MRTEPIKIVDNSHAVNFSRERERRGRGGEGERIIAAG